MKKNLLSEEQVKKIALAAKLDFDNDSLKKIIAELDETVTYIKVLDELDLKNTEATSQVTGLKNISDEDEIRESTKTYNNYFKVEAVLNE